MIKIIRVEQVRKAKNMTQEELASRAGTTQGAISLIETGERNPSLPMLMKIAEALECSAGELLNDKQE